VNKGDTEDKQEEPELLEDPDTQKLAAQFRQQEPDTFSSHMF
jgi:hypothetical protein